MACQTVVTQYILPLNQKCVCLEASHWQMPKLEAFPPLPPPFTVPPNPLSALSVQILSQSMRNWALPPIWAMMAPGKKLDIYQAPTVCQPICWAYPFTSSRHLQWPHFRKVKNEDRDGMSCPSVWLSVVQPWHRPPSV